MLMVGWVVIDAHGWRRICTSFCSTSEELCSSIAILAHHLCTTFVYPVILPFPLPQLIALDNRPGIRSIGIGESVKHIIAKAVLSEIRDEVLYVAGSL